MAVSLTIPDDDAWAQYTVTTSSSGPFNIDFAYFAEGDVVVVTTDSSGTHSTLTNVTDYTMTNTSTDGGFSGGSITLVTAVSNTTVTIYRDVSVARSANWVTGSFDVDDLNTEQNRIFAILQQFERDLSRAVALHIADTLASLDLPLLSTRKSKLMAFDASGLPDTQTSSDLSGLSTFAQKYQVAASEPSARADTTALQEGDIWFDTSNDQWKVYDGSAYQIGASLTTPVGTADINDNAITLAKMAGLARGKIIYGDASGDPAALTAGAADRVLQSDGTDISYGQLTAGMVPADLITLAMLAHGTANKVIGFDGSGVPAEITLPSTSSFTSSEITVSTGDQTYTQAHSLGAVPEAMEAVLRCKTTDLGYAVDDEVYLGDTLKISSAAAWGGTTPFKNATNCGLLQERDIYLPDRSSGMTPTLITYANWKLVFRASA